MSAPPRYLSVALPVPLGRTFTYRASESPDPGTASPQVGTRVLVELGRRKCLGVVVAEATEAPPGIEVTKIKPILKVLDAEPVLPPDLLGFLLELSRYYLAPVGEVLRLALPVLERATAKELEELAGKLKATGRIVRVVEATPTSELPDPHPPVPRGRAGDLLLYLRRVGPSELRKLTEVFKTAPANVRRLRELGLAQTHEREVRSDRFFEAQVVRDTPPRLNVGQTSAVAALRAALEGGPRRNFLLDGVTASGKTEVYLHAAALALEQGRGVIILVPEIALTPQLIGRFRARLGETVAALHSGLSEPQRLTMWQGLRSGRMRVVVGARSALFAPVSRLGLICVDEEHDPSFKQEEGVRYSARDMALLRAHRAEAVCVLGSATPSLASRGAVQAGRLHRLVLPERARHAATLPHIETIDLRSAAAGPSGDPLLSLKLHRAIEETLAEGGQTILFLNRRGFAPSLICESCGAIAQCPNCSVALTVHRRGRARVECHYCDYHAPLFEACQACSGKQLLEEGLGTERVEALLRETFPKARIARLDRDVAGGLKSETVLARMRSGDIDILVGTQMVTKGHDLPEVTLVGVLNADAALSLPDFRAAERTFHLLVQVAGRAGRAERPGRVLIQTRNPEHPAILGALRHDVAGFSRHEMTLREELGYPPFSHLALVRLDGPDESRVSQAARGLARLAREASSEVDILGPAPAPIARVRNRFRFQILLRATERRSLRAALLPLVRSETTRQVRVSVDIDPQSML